MFGANRISAGMWWLFRLLLGTIITIGLVKLFQVDMMDALGLVLASMAGYGTSFLLISLFKKNESNIHTKPVTH